MHINIAHSYQKKKTLSSIPHTMHKNQLKMDHGPKCKAYKSFRRKQMGKSL